jgi:hypothetical protein
MVVSVTGELHLPDGQKWRIVCHIIVAMRKSKRNQVRRGMNSLGSHAQSASGGAKRLARRLIGVNDLMQKYHAAADSHLRRRFCHYSGLLPIAFGAAQHILRARRFAVVCPPWAFPP